MFKLSIYIALVLALNGLQVEIFIVSSQQYYTRRAELKAVVEINIDLFFSQKQKINYGFSSWVTLFPCTRKDTKGKTITEKKNRKKGGLGESVLCLEDFTNSLGCSGNSSDDSRGDCSFFVIHCPSGWVVQSEKVNLRQASVYRKSTIRVTITYSD